MNQVTIQIQEKSFEDNAFEIALHIDGKTFNVQLSNPFNAKTEQLLEYYFEEYINKPYDDVIVQPAPKMIADYGENLFRQLFKGEAQEALQKLQFQKLRIEVMGSNPLFQSLYWETLKAPNEVPFVEKGVVFRRRTNVQTSQTASKQAAYPTINLLIVTARPAEEQDVNHRTVQRPLIDLIEQTDAKVHAHILRPGTYDAFVKHLNEHKGFYHIIHFDLHGSLMNFKTYAKQHAIAVGRNPELKPLLPKVAKADFQNEEKGFIFFESRFKRLSVPVEASQLATELQKAEIPIVILNACQSAKQENTDKETSLGSILSQNGIDLVLAMRYSVSVTAVSVFMKKLYEQLYQKVPIDRAIATARLSLIEDSERQATFNRIIELEDWLLPVVYWNKEVNLNLRNFEAQEKADFEAKTALPDSVQQNLMYGFFGRDLDILKIEKTLLTQNNILLLQSMGGAGKTTLLKYLAEWWLKTGFVEKVFYFGYDLKGYYLEEILMTIAKEIFSPSEYEHYFRLEVSQAQKEQLVLQYLQKHRCVLILDNTEAITGEKLAVRNTLPKEEQQNLQHFLQQLKGGAAFVLMGSRASEKWLQNGTFEDNHHLLQGLDATARTNFAEAIITQNGKDIEEYTQKEEHKYDFERLMKLLAGSPLAMKAVLPNLRQKSVEQVLKEFEEGVGDLDKGNPQDKTESMLKCIEYAYGNLSEEAQKVLLCFAPFVGVVNIFPEMIKAYFEELCTNNFFQHFPIFNINANNINKLISEGIHNGLLEREKINHLQYIIYLQPVFTYFLKKKFNKLHEDIKTTLQEGYIKHYDQIGLMCKTLITSQNLQAKNIGLDLIELEYQNLYKVLFLLLEKQRSVTPILISLDQYLDKKQLHESRLVFLKKVKEKIEIYDKISTQDCIEFMGILDLIAHAFTKKHLLEEAKELWNKVLQMCDDNNLSESHKALFYQNLGVVCRQQKELNEAKEYYTKALQIFQKNGNSYYEAGTYLNLGVLLEEQKNYLEAKQCYASALAIFKRDNKEHEIGKVYHNLGIVFLAQKDYNSAILYFNNAILIYKKYNDSYSMASVYQSIGNIYGEQKKYSKAKIFYEKALSKYEESNAFSDQGDTYKNLGTVSEKQKNYEMAKKYNNKALDIYKNNNNIHEQGQVHQNLGVILMRQKQYSQAQLHHEKALSIFYDINDIHRQSQVYQNLGLMADLQNKYIMAVSFYQKAFTGYMNFPEDTHSIAEILNNFIVMIKRCPNKILTQSLLNQAKSTFKNNPKALQQLEQIQQQLNNL